MAKYKIKKGFITQKINNKTTIFSGEESILHTLNESAAFIFNEIKLGISKEKIIQNLVNKYSISKKEAGEDFDEFLAELVEKRIITPIP